MPKFFEKRSLTGKPSETLADRSRWAIKTLLVGSKGAKVKSFDSSGERDVVIGKAFKIKNIKDGSGMPFAWALVGKSRQPQKHVEFEVHGDGGIALVKIPEKGKPTITVANQNVAFGHQVSHLLSWPTNYIMPFDVNNINPPNAFKSMISRMRRKK